MSDNPFAYLSGYTDDPYMYVIYMEDIVRKLLTEQAAERYNTTILTRTNTYGRELRTLQEHLREYKKHIDKDAVPITIIDPSKVHIGTAFNISTDDIIQRIMQHEGVPVEHVFLDWSQRIPTSFHSSTARTVDHRHAPFIMPESHNHRIDTSLVYKYGGRPLSERFSNLHEAYHYMDENLVNDDDIDYTPNPIMLLTHEDDVTSAIQTQHSEGFADVSAVGTLIRQGEEISLLDCLIEEREKSTDFGHQVADILRGFKNTIEDMGLETFRALDTAEASTLYRHVIDENGITAAQLKLAARIYLTRHDFIGSIDTDLELKQIDDIDQHDPDFQKAVYYSHYLCNHMNMTDTEQPVQTVPETAWRDDEDRLWRDRLANRAFADHQIITPETLALSYISLLDDLYLQSDPYETITFSRLGHIFMFNDHVNFVAENHIRGVDIFAYLGVPKPDFDIVHLEPKTTPEPVTPSQKPGNTLKL